MIFKKYNSVLKLQNLFLGLVDHVSYNKENDEGGQHDDHNFGSANVDATYHKKECAHRFVFLRGDEALFKMNI
ncbi:hypothetical protein SAMN05443550_101468 [Pedobacter hartonius]|uniref:Uncharacterized protein n=1 Tax=Pedobacter hartonius TaxID=425514 RepID=A0A1H3X3C8_9SPHI|nr:hypothetical protein SAMN05443550_101468 [Pedobacter hartonius]